MPAAAAWDSANGNDNDNDNDNASANGNKARRGHEPAMSTPATRCPGEAALFNEMAFSSDGIGRLLTGRNTAVDE
jgi:hypothetical protein